MNELILELYQTDDYQARLDLIEENRDRIDDTFVDFFGELITGIPDDQAKLALATFRATMLAEVSFVHANRADLRTAKRFAAHCLRAYQEGFRLFGELAGDHGKSTRNCLQALLADAGEFRKLGLEEEGWQAYWLADPISAAIESAEQPRDIEAGKLLAAAWSLERAGMRDLAADAREEAREKMGDERAFKKEKAWSKKLVGALPEELPPPDIYEGTSPESAHRFTSREVGGACVRQTPCPRCRGPMSFAGSSLQAGRGKAYDVYSLVCQEHSNHPPVTIYKDASMTPGMQRLGEVARELEKLQEKKLGKKADRSPPEPSPQTAASSDATEGTGEVLRVRFLGLVVSGVILFLISMVPALVCYGLFRWLKMPEPFWGILLGGFVGLVVYSLVRIAAGLLLGHIFRKRIAEKETFMSWAVLLIGLAAGGPAAFAISSWAAGACFLCAVLILQIALNHSKGQP